MFLKQTNKNDTLMPEVTKKGEHLKQWNQSWKTSVTARAQKYKES